MDLQLDVCTNDWREVATFRSYVDIASYADYLGISVINASPNSMIDAFERYDPEEEEVGE